MNFDFLVEEEHRDEPRELTLVDPGPGPNLDSMSRKALGKAVLGVFQRLVKESDWLYVEAKADPKAFMSLIGKMMPKQTIAEGLGDITVKLINRYGDTLEMSKTDVPAAGGGLGQPDDAENSTQIATGGSLNPVLKERYDD